MDPDELVDFVRRRGLAVLATTGPAGSPQAALVGVAATDLAEIVFDTVDSSRKVANIQRDPHVALVIGWDDEVTVQCEGTADIPTGDDLDRCRLCYFEQYPDGRGRASWTGLVYVRVRLTWLRFCDFRPASFDIHETTF